MSNLFSNQSFSEYSDEIRNKINQDIDQLPDEQVIGTSEEELISHFSTKYSISPIEIYEEAMQARHEDTKVSYGDYDRNRKYDGIKFSVNLPFAGDSFLWHLRPSTWTTSFPQGSVQTDRNGNNTLFFDVIVCIDQDPNTPNKLIADNLKDIKFYLEKQKKDILEFNQSLNNIVKTAVAIKKNKLSKKKNVLQVFKIPLTRNLNAPDIVPLQIKKRIIKPLPPVQNRPPEYGIRDEDYEHILNIIRHEGATYEATPATYKDLGEESLRDILLAHLNGHFQGDATGETFRKEGKTDIRIEYENRAAFVAECKLWHGDKKVLETIDQLLGYLTWRDSKTCIIIFNKEVAGFSSIQQKVPSIIQSHSNYVRRADLGKTIEWRYVFKSKDDGDRQITIHIFLFNLYVSK